jgi:hypothetical protein
VVGRLDEVAPEVLEFFEPAARIVMASPDPMRAMAAALATLSGITERPLSRSLLTQVCTASPLLEASHRVIRADGTVARRSCAAYKLCARACVAAVKHCRGHSDCFSVFTFQGCMVSSLQLCCLVPVSICCLGEAVVILSEQTCMSCHILTVSSLCCLSRRRAR